MPSSPGTDPAAAAPRTPDEERYAQLEDRYLRALADLDNFRKRSARDAERRVEEATTGVLRQWLEVADSIERALQGAGDGPDAAGLRAVHDQIQAILDRQGVQRVGAVGEPFDPDVHDAVGVHVTGEVPDHSIVDVAVPGYRSGDRIVRPAQVVVARHPEPEA